MKVHSPQFGLVIRGKGFPSQWQLNHVGIVESLLRRLDVPNLSEQTMEDLRIVYNTNETYISLPSHPNPGTLMFEYKEGEYFEVDKAENFVLLNRHPLLRFFRKLFRR